MIILGIETSCDETAASVIEGRGNNVKVLSNVVSSQIDIHKKYGGVVPEVAAREHVLNILPVINEALSKAGIKRKEAAKKIGLIAVTTGPGLVTSLLVGVETAKNLSYAWGIPAIGINHIEGHIYANFINPPTPFNKGGEKKLFPALILTVSGGHTMLVLMKEHGKYKTIGETRDDAAGEAFDKAAKILNIGYPGGPSVAFQATKIKDKNEKIKNIVMPRPMINSGDYDFSFSGLKTALLYAVQKDKNYKKRIPEYCHEFQQAVIDVLVKKIIKAAKEHKVKTIMLSGGVSANKELRKQMKNAVKFQIPNSKFQIPDFKYTTDNAAMIATAGYFRAKLTSQSKKSKRSWQKLKVDCNLKLK